MAKEIDNLGPRRDWRPNESGYCIIILVMKLRCAIYLRALHRTPIELVISCVSHGIMCWIVRWYSIRNLDSPL